MTITAKELEVLAIFAAECTASNGAATAEEMKADNMTWSRASNIRSELKWKAEAVGAVMGSLQEKGLAVDTGERMENGVSKKATKNTDWHLTAAGIDAYFAALANEGSDGEEDTSYNEAKATGTDADAQAAFEAAFKAAGGFEKRQLCRALRALAKDWTGTHKAFREHCEAMGLNGNNASAEYYAGRR